MVKRTIIGVLLLIVFILSFYYNVFPFLLGLIYVVGTYELISLFFKNKKYDTLIYLIIFTLGLASCFLLYNLNPLIVFVAILLVVFNDSFAYLLGKLFGKTHFSKISPNKTIEGIIYGIIGTYGLFLTINYFANNQFLSILSTNQLHIPGIFVILVVCICGIIGDLYESFIKRRVGIKDTSNLLGEQGGIIDRVDSWIITMIVLALLFLI